MDFFSQKELVGQTGHDVGEWPLVILKELVDNAIDACEDRDLPPEIVVTADADGITVSDNGPGLPDSTLQGTLDFSVRVSSREAYVSPDRGAQGNALKTLAAMPYVIDPEGGRLVVVARGKRHEISVRADPVSQRPVVTDMTSDDDSPGTMIRVQWPPRTDARGDVVWPFDDLRPHHHRFRDRVRQLVEGFAIFNPHTSIRLDWFGESATWEATDPNWNKWRPSRPTSAHWYQSEHLERLIAACIAHDRDQDRESRTVREFLANFDGLAGSAKRGKVLADADMYRTRLVDLVENNGLSRPRIERLLAAMKAYTRPVTPRRLGVIGEEHFRSRLAEMGIVEESFKYEKKLNMTEDGLPYVLETAFGWRGPKSDDTRLIHTGVNWSAAIGNPFRTFGSTGEGLEAMLTGQRAGQEEPIVLCVHLAHPRVQYTDRGKTALVLE